MQAKNLNLWTLLALLWQVLPCSLQAEPLDQERRFLDDSLPTQEPRPRLQDVQHLDLDLRVDLQAGQVRGTATYRGRLLAPTPSLLFHAALEVDVTQAEWLNGDKTTAAIFTRNGDELHVTLPSAQGAGNWLLRLTFVAMPQRGFVFVRPSPDAADRPLHAWTQGETQEARHWLPCPDDPDERLTWDVAVTAPAPDVVISGGRLIGRKVQAGQATTNYKMASELPVYLLTIVIGPFVEVVHPHAQFASHSYVLADKREDAARAFVRLPQMLEFFSHRLGVAYPWGSYGQVAVGEFTFGGMENASMTTLADRHIPDARQALDHPADGLMAHELAHQWFGDLRTCRTWADIWLQEGGASYATALWFEHAHGPDRLAEALDQDRQGYFNESAQYARPVVTDRYADADDLFDGHTYAKGAWVLHMLRAKLGDEAFFAGLQAFFKAGPASAETDDLRHALEQASGQSLRGFFTRWLRQAGYPKLEAKVRYDSSFKQLQIDVAQVQRVGPLEPLFDLDLPIAVRSQAKGAPVLHHLRLHKASGSLTIPCEKRPELIEFDPQMTLLAHWQVQAGPDDLAAMRDASTSADVRLRAVRDLARDLSSGRAMEALLRALTTDSARHVRAAAAQALGHAARSTVRDPLQRAARTDAEAMVRAAALQALGDIQDLAALPVVEQAAKLDQSYACQTAALRAAFALDRIGSRDLLLTALTWPSHGAQVQVQALELLGSLADVRDKELILAATQAGRGADMRQGALAALASFALHHPPLQDELTPPLRQALQDPNHRVRQAATQALVLLDLPTSRDVLQAAADREPLRRLAEQMRHAAAQLGHGQPVQDRLRQLEDQLRSLQKEMGERKQGSHG